MRTPSSIWTVPLLAAGLLVQWGRCQAQRILAPNEVPQDRRNYNHRDNYCWLLAHTSRRVGDKIWIDGGTSKYRLELNGEEVGVPDFNGYTMEIDLTSDFDIDAPPLKSYAKNPTQGVPVTNRGGMWNNQSHILVQGGHFYNRTEYTTSAYWVRKDAIPEYGIWAFDLEEHEWSKVNFRKEPSDAIAERAVSGAATCLKDQDTCYYFGGYFSGRTSADTPGNWSVSQRRMLEYDVSSQVLQNRSIDGYGGDHDGYSYGILEQLPLDCDNDSKGLLLSLMTDVSPTNRPNTTSESLRGNEVSLTNVMLYDIEEKKWYNQSTRYWDDEKPQSRTRFCSVVVQDEETKSWDLWIYGGQSVSDPSRGVADVYVLTMPAFIWVRVSIPFKHVLLRGMTCHAVGSQMIIVGGAPPGIEVDINANCSSSMLNVLDMNNPGWKSTFSNRSPAYKQPPAVRKAAEGAREPRATSGWADARVKALFERSHACPDSADSSRDDEEAEDKAPGKGAIAGIVVGSVAGALLIGALAWLIWRSWTHRGPTPPLRNSVVPGCDTGDGVRIELPTTDGGAAEGTSRSASAATDKGGATEGTSRSASAATGEVGSAQGAREGG